MEDWIRNVEKLMGEDEANGSPCPLLVQFEEDYSSESLLNRLNDYLERTEPSQAVLDELKECLIENVLKDTVEKINDAWSTETHFAYDRIFVLLERFYSRL